MPWFWGDLHCRTQLAHDLYVILLVVRGSAVAFIFLFFFNDTATTEIYTLSLHDALPIYNGFMDAEPVKLFVRGANVWRGQEEWPPKRATPVSYYLRKGPSGSVTSLNDSGRVVE